MVFTTDYKLEEFLLNTQWEQLPNEVQERLRGCMLDLLGALIAGSGSEQFQVGVRLAKKLFPLLAFAGALSGMFCVLGHIFPVWMGFAGGKGLACLGGLVLGHSWRLFLALLIAEILLTLAVGYICVMALTLSVLFPVIYGLSTRDLTGALILAGLIPVVYYKHLPNLKRIFEGREARISWLWNAEAEEARLEKQYSGSEWKQIYKKTYHK